MSAIRAHLSCPTQVIHVLIGPRQVGKTTIARQIQDFIGIPSIYATADSPVPLDSAWIETQWRRAVAEGAASDSPVLLILDEMQKVRGWSETLKLFWDNRPGGPEIKRNYKNVHDDVKALESIGLIERGEDVRYSVPWDEINTSFMHEQ